MPDKKKENILKMLCQIDERIQAARQMVQDERDCTEVLMELSAVKEDLFSMSMYLLNEDISAQLDRIMEEDSEGPADLEGITELINIFIK